MSRANLLSKRFFDKWVLSAGGRWLVVLGFACFFIWALFPFDWDPPRKLENGGRILSDGTLSFQEAGIVTSKRAHEWFSKVQAADEFVVSMKVRSLALNQTGPARVLTFAIDHHLRNITLGQSEDSLSIVVRTKSDTGFAGPEYLVPGFFSNYAWREALIRVSSERIRVESLGEVIYDAPIDADGVVESWDPLYALSFGNELTGKRPWLGEIAKASVEVGSESFDLLDSEKVELAPTYWSARYGPRFISMVTTKPGPKLVLDYFSNFVCFIPLGFFVAVRCGSFLPIVRTIMLCGSVSLGVEVAQIFFEQSFPSIYDWILNTAGAAAGAILGLRAYRDAILAE